jgi:hypothetical protein
MEYSCSVLSHFMLFFGVTCPNILSILCVLEAVVRWLRLDATPFAYS